MCQVAQGVPERLARAVDRCLAKRPEARFQRAEDLSSAMTRLLQEHSAPPLPVRAFVTDSKLLSVPARLYAVFVGGAIFPVAVVSFFSATAPLARLGLAGGVLIGAAAPWHSCSGGCGGSSTPATAATT